MVMATVLPPINRSTRRRTNCGQKAITLSLHFHSRGGQIIAKKRFSRSAFTTATKQYTTAGKSSTHRGEEHFHATGKLNSLVDPAEFNVIRESRMRFEPNDA